MATLIQSKQIQGIVTASVIEGDFAVSGGSVNLGAASGVTGSFSGSFVGDGSGIQGIDYSQITNTPVFLPGDNITITSGSNIITITSTASGGGSNESLNSFTASYYSDSSSFDSRIVGISASGSGADWNTNLQNIPSGIISGSAQISSLGFITSSHTDISSLNDYTSSNDLRITNLESTTSSLDTRITQLSDSTGSYETIGRGIISSSEQFPSGLVSGSEQILGGTGILSGSHSDLSSLNTYTSSTDERLSNIEAATGSYLTSETDSQTLSISGDQLTITTGNTITIPTGSTAVAGTISGSQQISDLGFISSSHTDIADLNTFTSSIQTEVDALSAATSSYLTSETDSQTLSIDGDQLTISSGNTITIPSGSSTTDYTQLTNVPSGLVSGSSQVDYDVLTGGKGLLSGSHTDISSLNDYTSSTDARLSGIDSITSSLEQRVSEIESNTGSYDDLTNISSLNTFTSSIDTSIKSKLDSDGVISGSQQITDLGFISSSHTVIESLNTFTSSIQTEVDVISAQTSSYLTELPDGLVSGSVLRTLGGTGVLSGSKTDISSLNVFTSSIQTEVDGLSSFTSSYLTEIPAGTISGSSQLTSSYDTRYALSGSSGETDFDGNRIVSQEKLPTMFSSSFNPATSGSIVDFLNAVFYPNSDPAITSGNQTISEYSSSGSPIFTLEATDPEGQSLTFGTGSTYTDDLVRVASNGVVTLNAVPTSASFNTDLVGGSHGHTFIAKTTDTFNSSIEKDITIFVTPNSTPVFRETSISGNVITSVTSNLNESSADDTLLKRVFFTDANGDSITIHSSSIDGNHFEVIKSSTYVDILQNTGSLNYEEKTTYNFSISASDEHYELGQDSDSIVVLPITVNVTDNLVPTISNQSLSSINENSSNGTTVGTISAADNEGDTITFANFTLYKLELDNVNVSSGSYGGTSQLTDPHENPFQMSSSGVVTRKVGVFLNSDLINEYQYTVEVKDSYNESSNPAIITIPIDDDTPATISDNWSAGPYIKESEENGTTIKTTNYGSSTADYNSNQSGTFTSSNPAIVINGSGNL